MFEKLTDQKISRQTPPAGSRRPSPGQSFRRPIYCHMDSLSAPSRVSSVQTENMPHPGKVGGYGFDWYVVNSWGKTVPPPIRTCLEEVVKIQYYPTYIKFLNDELNSSVNTEKEHFQRKKEEFRFFNYGGFSRFFHRRILL